MGGLLELIRVYGTAAAGIALFAFVTSLFVEATTPVKVELDLIVQSSGDPTWSEVEAELARWFQKQEALQAEECGIAPTSSDNEQPVFSCTVTVPDLDAFFDAFELLQQQFPVDNVEIFGWEMATRLASNHVPLWSIAFVAVIYLVLVVFMTRRIDVGRDLASGTQVLRSRPWLLLTPLGIWFVVANISFGLLGMFFGDAVPLPLSTEPIEEGLEGALRSGMAMMLSPWHILLAITLAPLLEEAVFRQVAYRRLAAHGRVLMHAIVNAWFFMLAHIAVAGLGWVFGVVGNPVQSSAVVIPVWFFVGLFFFWVRHRYDSLSLCIFLHAFYNGATLIAVYWLLTS